MRGRNNQLQITEDRSRTEDCAKGMSEVLPKDVVARLGDRSYDKRKAAALEIENMVKKLQDA